MLIISSQSFYKDELTKHLVEELSREFNIKENGNIYYEYPLFTDVDDKAIQPKLLIVSPLYGVIIINTSVTTNIQEASYLDDDTSVVENQLFSKLIKSSDPALKKDKRTLNFNLFSILYLPNIPNNYDFENLFCNTYEKVVSTISGQKMSSELSFEALENIYAIIEGSKVILKPKKREIPLDDTSSKGAILKRMEEQMAYFDKEQKYAALSQIDGPQRIRGLAGSGKTIILCLKAALIHLKHPKKKILYTFMTKSLYDYIETMIIRFYKFFGDGSLPDFDYLQIKHAWGGATIAGVYFTCCKENNIMPMNLGEAKAYGANNPFALIVKDLLVKTKGTPKKLYDYVLIDEAQDFSPEFYQLCRAIVYNDCLVWGYDDFQNIYNVNIQDTISTFKNEFGAEGIDLIKLREQHEDLNNDIVLDKTYRNPREILILAHAIGFGIYNDHLIQALENNQHWKDFGYNVLHGECKIGDRMVIERPKENSPLIISDLQTPDEMIQVFSHVDKITELAWLCSDIQKTIEKENIRPDDILIISIDDKTCKSDMAIISQLLNKKNVSTFNVTSNFYTKGFIEEGSVTLSTIHKAKGNEAAIVYVIGCEVFDAHKNSRSMRNKAFTAFTRAKGWLKISGVDIEQSQLVKEIQTVKENNFILNFTQTETFVIQRDRAKAKENKKKVSRLLQETKMSLEDIELIIKQLKEENDDRI